MALTRRGIVDADSARRFLAGGEPRPPTELAGIAEAVHLIEAAIAAQRRITVFGDFDVDGVCATSILVKALRETGADCDWLIPDRLAEGYGLREAAIERLAARGTGLIVTVDCGITAVEEVAFAKRLGLELIVTDHHRPGERLPDCLIVHPGVAGYSCPALCGAAVAWKLATALREAAGRTADGQDDLDLVALATIADLVPLTGENRDLVRRGLAVARRAARPGLAELIKVASLAPAALDEGDLGFKLGPRVNAAGRLYRADAGVELFLTGDADRARAIAAELDRANHERRRLEQVVLGEAERNIRESRNDGGALPAGIVAAGRDWHPGVIGIVASRLVEQHARPTVVVSIDAEGKARGSARGVAGFDLLEALHQCADRLGRYGGHRAAAGLELKADDIDGFAAAFATAVEARLGPEPAPRPERVDAFAAGPELGLELAEELERLAPFGIGNPGVNLVVPGAVTGDERPMGAEGEHLRFTVFSGGYRARAVAFGRSSLGCEQGDCADLVMRLERNQWNGSIEPRLRLRELIPAGRPGGGSGYEPYCADEEWWRRFNAALDGSGLDAESERVGAGRSGPAQPHEGSVERHASGTGQAVIAELLSSGGSLVAVTADAGRRAGLALGPAGVARFGRGSVAVCSFRDGADRFRAAREADFGLTDYRSVLIHAGTVEAGKPFDHLALIDPPASPGELRAARELVAERGTVHALWDEPARAFALAALPEQLPARDRIAALYRALRAGDAGADQGTRARLEGSGPLPPGPDAAALAVGVLIELGLVEISPAETDVGARRLRVVSSKKTDLEHSRLFRRCRDLREVKAKFLETIRQA